MPFRTADPVLTLDGFRMRNIDPQDPAGLFGIWSLFQRASGMTQDGLRAENMTWRLWNQEMVKSRRVRRNTSASTASIPIDKPSRSNSSTIKVPALSRSVDSLSSHDSDDEDDDALSLPADADFTTATEDDAWSDPSKELTPIVLETLVTSIRDRQELKALSPLPKSYRLPIVEKHAPPTPIPPELNHESTPTRPEPKHESSSRHIPSELKHESTPTPTAHSITHPTNVDSSTSTVDTGIDSYTSPATSSDTSVETNTSSHSIVRGFKPGQGISTYRSQSQLAPLPSPITKPQTQPKAILPRRKNQMFTLGASSGDDEGSLRDHMSPSTQARYTAGNESRVGSEKKQTSFKDEVTEIKSRFCTQEDYGSAIESSDEEDEDESDSDDDDDNCESAIEDDEEDEWEDATDAAEESQNELTFPRIDSKPNLVSRRSLLTDKVAEGQRAYAMQEAAMAEASHSRRRSRTSNPNGPSLPPSPDDEEDDEEDEDDDEEGEEGSNLGAGAKTDGPASAKSKPISMSFSHIHPPCPPGPPTLSPRSTRRNMLTTELGVSLRKNMLLERSHRNVAITRRHTSTDLSKYPDGAGAPQDSSSKTDRYPKSGWKEYFNNGIGEYHQRGW